MPEVSFRLCTAHFSRPLVSQQRPSACTKAALIPCSHSWSCVIFILLLSFCFKRKKKKKLPKLMYDLSLSLRRHTGKKNGQSEFTEITHISTYYVYKRLFSPPPQWKCLFSSRSCLSVPELVTCCVSTFPFCLHLCVFFCWCCIN